MLFEKRNASVVEIKDTHGRIIYTYVGADLWGADLRDADLRRADLRGAKLQGANLWGTDLRGADLRDANLRDANLRGADLWGANLRDANLWGANLRDADLRDANLRDANLWGANLRGTDLKGADLRGADLRDANLRDADLRGAKIDKENLGTAQTTILPEGDIIGWKKCKYGILVKLLIPKEARRLNASGRKCRAEYAKVLEVVGGNVGISIHNSKTEYRVGDIVHCDKWDDDRWNECSGGIHFFITRIEAENY